MKLTATQLKTAKLSPKQYGDWYEAQVQAGLDEMMRKHQMFFARLYDTRSANSFLPKQAGDFIGNYRGRGYLLEVKATKKYESLADPGAMRSLLKDHQVLGGYLMARSRGLGLIVFRSYTSQTTEIWDGAQVREAYITPRGKLLRHRDGGFIGSQEGIDDLAKSDFIDVFNMAYSQPVMRKMK